MDGSTITIAGGIGALATGVGGCIVVIHEFRRRDRKALRRENEDLAADVTELRVALVIARRYAFQLAEKLADHGVEFPKPPTEVPQEDWDRLAATPDRAQDRTQEPEKEE